jgi:hypothetical protein
MIAYFWPQLQRRRARAPGAAVPLQGLARGGEVPITRRLIVRGKPKHRFENDVTVNDVFSGKANWLSCVSTSLRQAMVVPSATALSVRKPDGNRARLAMIPDKVDRRL